VGGKTPSGLGKDALLDFRVEVTLGGETLTPGEAKVLLAGSNGLALIRGQWVEVDPGRLARTMQRFQEAERLAAEGGLSFAEAMRMLAGADIAGDGAADRADHDWSRVTAGPWLAEVLAGLRSPEGLARVDPGSELRGTLRPYQQVGVRWLHLLSRLGLGACLADDMGLGKTIQVLALLLVQRKGDTQRLPSLLVAPASLLANWAAEIERFAPSLTAVIAHPSAMPAEELKSIAPQKLSATNLVIASAPSTRPCATSGITCSTRSSSVSSRRPTWRAAGTRSARSSTTATTRCCSSISGRRHESANTQFISAAMLPRPH
jgi:non-specific serine/threonine protein kinase